MEPDQARTIARPDDDESDNDSYPPPYRYPVYCRGFRSLVMDVMGFVPFFMGIQGCGLSESKQNHSTLGTQPIRSACRTFRIVYCTVEGMLLRLGKVFALSATSK